MIRDQAVPKGVGADFVTRIGDPGDDVWIVLGDPSKYEEGSSYIGTVAEFQDLIGITLYQ